MPNNLLLTGAPGRGKTTVICRVVERSGDRRLGGFYTDEVRYDGRRVGFRAVGLGGSSVLLAHVDFPGRRHVGPYGVDFKGFEEVGHIHRNGGRFLSVLPRTRKEDADCRRQMLTEQVTWQSLLEKTNEEGNVVDRISIRPMRLTWGSWPRTTPPGASFGW